MREIKFRAWQKSLKRMVEVSCVKDLEVTQYTGLKDKNGTEIYEGDIVKLILDNGEERYFEVSIRKMIRQVLDFNYELSDVEIMGVCFIWNGMCLFPCVDEYGISDTTKMEIVGNVYANPELLAGEHDD